MKDKLRIIFKTYLIGLIAFTVGYTFLHWLLSLELTVIDVKEPISTIYTPLALSAIFAWLILRRKLKILNLKAKKESWIEFYCMIAWVSIAMPTIIAQQYIITATGKITHLNTINEISASSPTKYYTLKSYYIDKSNIGEHSSFEVTGRHNSNFNMHVYIVMPIFESIQDTSTKNPIAWLGVEYYEQISNSLNPEEKELRYQQFYKYSKGKFSRKDFSGFTYFDRIGNSDDRVGFRIATRKTNKFKGGYTILLGSNEPFEARNGKKFPWFIGSFLVGSCVFLIMIIIPPIDKYQLKRIKEGIPDKSEINFLNNVFSFLKPKGNFFITPIILYLSVILFILMFWYGLGFSNFKSGDLIYWGANFGPHTRNGELWRLIWGSFLNNGILQLLVNMCALLFTGLSLENFLGRKKFALVYIITTIGAGIISMWWNEDTISVGASGAIFGLYGFILALIYEKYYVVKPSIPFIISTSIFIIYHLINGLIGDTDNAAHFGGLVTGFMTGFLILPWLNPQSQEL